jgi:uncharacterized protein (DUF362 family)
LAVSSKEQNSDRRRFLQGVVGAALATTGCGSSCSGTRAGRSDTQVNTFIAKTEAVRAASSHGKPRVVVVRAKKVLTHGYDADAGAVRAMLEAGLLALAATKDAVSALSRYVRSGDRVGLKVNGLAGRNAATHVELVDALSVLLAKAGVEGRRQVAFDRFTRDLTASGFTDRSRSGGYRVVGNDDAGHEDDLVQMPSSASRLSRVLTSQVDGVLNLPVLKQHMLAGMTGALKNNFGCIHNPNKMHIDNCDPYVAEVNAVPAIRDKQRLVIMDAFRPVVDNGPSYQPGMGEIANALLFATDLVAIDAVGLAMLEGLRAKRDLPPLAKVGLAPTYLATAARMGLGVSDRARIDVVEIEV